MKANNIGRPGTSLSNVGQPENLKFARMTLRTLEARPKVVCVRERKQKIRGKNHLAACGNPAFVVLAYGREFDGMPVCKFCLGEVVKDLVAVLSLS